MRSGILLRGSLFFLDDLLAQFDALVANRNQPGAAPDIAGLLPPFTTEGTAFGRLATLLILLAGNAIYTFITNTGTAWPGNQALRVLLILATERAGVYEVPSLVLLPGHTLLSLRDEESTAVIFYISKRVSGNG
jgi:hypothetical protein